MISTPQVILSLDTSISLTKFITSRYEKDPKNRSYSAFMTEEVKRLTLCFTHNSGFANLLSFKNHWGTEASSEHQTQFELEILDPTGEFERTFLGFYATDGDWKAALYEKFNNTVDEREQDIKNAKKNYEDYKKIAGSLIAQHKNADPTRGTLAYDPHGDVINRPLSAGLVGALPPTPALAMSWWKVPLKWIIGAEVAGAAKNIWDYENMKDALEQQLPSVHKRVFRSWLAKAKLLNLDAEFTEASKLAQTMANIRTLPMTTNMWISVGMGEDLATYSPPQLVRITDIKYGIEKEGIRKFTLFLAPISGLSTLDADVNLIANVQDSNSTLVKTNPISIFKSGPGSGGGLRIKSPSSIINRVVEDALEVITDDTCYAMIHSIERGLKRKFNEFVELHANQVLSTQQNLARIGLDKDLLGGPTEKDPEAKRKYFDVGEFFDGLDHDLRSGFWTGDGETGEIEYGIPGSNEHWGAHEPTKEELAENERRAAGKQPKLYDEDDPDPTEKWDAYTSIKLTNAQQKCIVMAIYSAFFSSLPGLSMESNFIFGSNEKVPVPLFDTLSKEYLNQEGGNSKFLKDIYNNVTCKVSFIAGSRLDAKNKIKDLIRACSLSDEPVYIVTWPDLDALGKVDPKPKLVVITPTIWNHLLNGTLDTYIAGLTGDFDTEGIKAFEGAWTAFKELEASVSGIYPLNDPYNPLRLDQLLLNRQGQFKDKAVIRTLETLSIGDKSINTFKKLKQKIRKDKIPIFVYGFANSNIVDFEFDLTLWFAHLLNVVPQSLQNNLLTKAVERDDPGDEKGIRAAMDVWKNFATNENKGERDKAKQELDAIIDEWWDKKQTTRSTETSLIGFGLTEWNNFESRSTGAARKSSPGDDDVGATKEQYREAAYSLLARIFKAQRAMPGGLRNITPSHADSVWVDNILKLDNSISQNSFTGTITTLPIFDLASPTKLGKSAIIYFVEPQLLGPEKLKNIKPYQTWLSGEYWIMGYETVIEKNDIYTRFNVTKKPALT